MRRLLDKLIAKSVSESELEFQDLARPLLSKKFIFISLTAFFLLFTILLYVPYLFNHQSLRFGLEQKISEFTKANLEIKGQVEVNYFPRPNVILKNVVFRDFKTKSYQFDLYAKEVKVNLSFLSSMLANFKVTKIDFNEGIVQMRNQESYFIKDNQEFAVIVGSLPDERDQGGFAGGLLSLKNFNPSQFSLQNLPDLSFNGMRVLLYSKDGSLKAFEFLQSDFSFAKNSIKAIGAYKNQSLASNFNLDLNLASKAKNSKIELQSPHVNLSILGNFPKGNLEDFQGELSAEIFNFKNFYKSYISDSGIIFEKINNISKAIKLRGQVTKKDAQIEIEKLAISSNLMNGQGDLSFDFSGKIPLVDVALEIENIDLDSLLLKTIRSSTQARSNSVSNLGDIGNSTLDLSKDFRDYDLTFEAKIKRAKYYDEELKNIDFYSLVSRTGQILIMPLNFEGPGESKFRMVGVVSNGLESGSKQEPKLIAKLDAFGENLADILKWLKFKSSNLKFDNLKKFNLYSSILLSENLSAIDNLYLSVNEGETEVLGSFNINHSSATPSIISKFNVRNLTIEDFFHTSIKSTYLSPGNFLKKTLWLNQIDSNHDLTLNFEKLHYGDLVFKNKFLKTRFGPGYLVVEKFNLESENGVSLETSMNIDISQAIPRFDLVLRSENFEHFSKELPIEENPEKAPEEIFNFTQKPNPKKIHQNIVDYIFALPSFENFKGNLLLDFAKINLDGLEFEDLKVFGKLNSGIVEFDEFSSNFAGGKLDFKGSAAFNFEKSLSGNLTLQEVQMRPLLTKILGLDNIEAIANVSASISSSGVDKSSFLQNLNSDAKFSAANATIYGFGLDSLIKQMFNPYYFQPELTNLEKTFLAKEEFTKINEASGLFTIDRGKENLFRTSFSGRAFNGISSGKFDLVKDEISGTTNILFLTGNREKQIPINVASNFKGNFKEVNQTPNLSQAKQYIDLANEQVAAGFTEVRFKEAAKAEEKPKVQDQQEKNPNFDFSQIPNFRPTQEQQELFNRANQIQQQSDQ